MSNFTVTKLHIRAGIWEGFVDFAGSGAPTQPALECWHEDERLDGLSYAADPDVEGRWTLRIAIPPHALRDGVQVFQITDTSTEEILSRFTILTDELFDDGLREEVALLRAELDMLKRAVRRLSLEE